MPAILFAVFFFGVCVGIIGTSALEGVQLDAARKQCVIQNGGEECIFHKRFVPKNTN